MSSAQILVHIEKPVNYTLFEVKWIPFSSQIVTLGSHPRGTGVMQIYDMSKGQLNLLKEVCFATGNVHSFQDLHLNCFFCR